MFTDLNVGKRWIPKRLDVGRVDEAFLPLSWRLGQLEFHIENELAEVVDAEVRIESPDPEAMS